MKWFTLLICTLTLFSCDSLTEVSKIKTGVDGTGTLPDANKGVSNETINSWVYDNMRVYYLWGDNMPIKANTKNSLTPDKYFASLLYQYGTTDRFSWIEEDAEELSNSLNGITKSSGFSYTPYLAGERSKNVFFAVRYAIKGSPAEMAGIKRGDLITKVNGIQIDTSNYLSVLSPDVLTFTLGEMGSGGVTSTAATKTVTKAVIQNFPVHVNKVLEVGNKKVAYLVYNQFITGTRADEAQFDNELRSVFGAFKTAGVSELVLDLRYNGGGAISSANILSSLIVKDLKPGTLMSKQVWSPNAKLLFNLPESAYESKWMSESNNLGSLQRVFVLTSRGTASASELVINNLKPFMEVIIIGENTYGKDVGSVTLDDEENNYRWTWGMQPIVLRTVNALGEAKFGTKDGFAPTYLVVDNQIPFKAFGDPQETYLKVALDLIKGVSTSASARMGGGALDFGGQGGFDNPRNNIRDMYWDIKQ